MNVRHEILKRIRLSIALDGCELQVASQLRERREVSYIVQK